VKISLLCFTFLIAGSLTACNSGQDTGNKKLSVTAISSIKNGITTKEQVRAMLGNPQSTKTQLPVRQSPGMPLLPAKYTASEIWAFWTDNKERTSFSLSFTAGKKPKQSRYLVIIYFDEQGIVLDCETETSNS
jgi:hypothetical protein